MKTISKLILLAIIAAVTATAFAAEVPTEKKAEFRKLVIQRNNFQRQLQTYDMQSAELLKQGKDTTKVNAKQVTIQDRMDLNQLKLETMAARYDLEIPDLPDLTKQPDNKDPKAAYGSDAFQRGRTRTMLELKRQTFYMLRSIDYSVILGKLKEN